MASKGMSKGTKESAEKREGEQEGKWPFIAPVCLSTISQQGCLRTQTTAAFN